ncbi:hypothetical protein Pyrfu_0344 [Pyrolobus fumarii 1A]|uniref:Uncharacterized protein n=1 Tax=Pyrolobus fumarii (strain DSM 11204 / 1A) TaxID=694429 RepID=G0EFP5_PYRF1|nr:hypothetical protein [Pyrolobus fumarii]AEM38216.1 hypothetical protein Pyrfu_0344 [Pyrolobus fumarii 1A]
MTRVSNRGWIVDPHSGAIIDPETGVVIDDSPVDLHPEYRAYDTEELLARDHYTPVERPREPTRRERLEDIAARGGLPETDEDLKQIREEIGGWLRVGESRAIDICGVRCLGAYRVLRRVYKLNPNTALDALQEAVYGDRLGAPRRAVRTARSLLEAWREAVSSTLVRLAAKPLQPIDVYRAAIILASRVRRGAVKQVIVETRGVKVQVTRGKLEAPARLGNLEEAERALRHVASKLGVEITEPKPMVATSVLHLPFRIEIHGVPEGLHERLVILNQGDRLKVMDTRDEFTALVYPKTINIYVRSLSRNLTQQLDLIILRLITLLANYSHD